MKDTPKKIIQLITGTYLLLLLTGIIFILVIELPAGGFILLTIIMFCLFTWSSKKEE